MRSTSCSVSSQRLLHSNCLRDSLQRPAAMGLAGQIDDDVHVVEMIQPVQAVEQGDVVTEQIIGPAVLAGQDHHLVCHLEVRHQAATDEPRAPVISIFMCCLPDPVGSTLEAGAGWTRSCF